MKVLAGCPVRDRGWILQDHIDALRSQVDGLFYLVNDCTDDTEDILIADPWIQYGTYNTGYPHCDRARRSDANMARVFNEWLEWTLDFEYDLLYLCSSDVVVGEGLVERLVRTHRSDDLGNPIVGPLMRSSAGAFNWMDLVSEEPLVYGRGLDHTVRDATGPWEVGMVGGCLLPRDAVESEATHRDHPQTHIAPWFQDLRKLGYRIMVEPRVKTTHWFAPEVPLTWDGRIDE